MLAYRIKSTPLTSTQQKWVAEHTYKVLTYLKHKTEYFDIAKVYEAVGLTSTARKSLEMLTERLQNNPKLDWKVRQVVCSRDNRFIDMHVSAGHNSHIQAAVQYPQPT